MGKYNGEGFSNAVLKEGRYLIQGYTVACSYRLTLSHCDYIRFLQAYIVTLWILTIFTGLHCHIVNTFDLYRHRWYIVTLWILSIFTGIHCHIVNTFDFYRHKLSHCEQFRFLQACIVTLWTFPIFTGIHCHIVYTFDFSLTLLDTPLSLCTGTFCCVVITEDN